MMKPHYALLFLLLLAFLILIPNAYADDDTVELDELDDYLAAKLGISLFPAQLLTTAIMLGLFVFPTLLLARGHNEQMIAALGMTLVVFGFCIALSWLPYWFLIIVVMIVALMFSGKMRDWISGGR